MKKSKIFYLFIILFSVLFSESDDTYVILISFDGFRYDYMERVDTPNFDRIAKDGIKAKSLKPIFPSFTFPNHYAIATGCYADKHKILGNEFSTFLGEYSYKNKDTVQDAKWYGGEPIWVTAEKNGIITATYFWVGSEAKIGGYYPTYYKNYQSGIDSEVKIKQVVDWLELPIQERPRLICLYFNEPDHAGHVYGADSKEVNEQIKISDDILGTLIESLKKLDIYNNINFIIVSDHGMVDVSEKKVINIDDFNIPGVVHGKGPIMSVIDREFSRSKGFYDEKKSLIVNIDIPHVTVVSSRDNNDLHYHNPYYNFLLIADEGWMLYTQQLLKEYNGKLPVKGMHGYDSNSMNMHAIFYAYGPQFKSNMQIDTFELIHIYPMLCKLLDISPYKNIDGKLNVLQGILN